MALLLINPIIRVAFYDCLSWANGDAGITEPTFICDFKPHVTTLPLVVCHAESTWRIYPFTTAVNTYYLLVIIGTELALNPLANRLYVRCPQKAAVNADEYLIALGFPRACRRASVEKDR